MAFDWQNAIALLITLCALAYILREAASTMGLRKATGKAGCGPCGGCALSQIRAAHAPRSSGTPQVISIERVTIRSFKR
jgi:hypothetical protein